jgi:large subunit ribosomal protein L12
MEYVYGAMLLHSAGKKINEKNLKQVLDAAGVKTDDAKIKALTASLGDVNIEDVLAKATIAAPTPAPAPAAEEPKAEGKEKPAEKKEEAKEEAKEEVSEEEVAEGLGALFG